MTHANILSPTARRLSLSAFPVAVVVAAVFMLGCGDENAGADEVGTVTQKIVGDRILIHYADNRVGTSVRVGITAVDQSNGGFYGGNAWVSGSLSNTFGYDYMTWTENGLSENGYYGGSNGWIDITDWSHSPPHLFNKMTVTVTATINGACHTDSEPVDLSRGGDKYLYFDGHGASWNGNCWVANLLKPCPNNVCPN